jgi:DNA repair exonuclease SbcCD nuclease subunit
MKVIAIGDPHFKIKNMQQVDIFIEKMLSLIKTENPDFIVVLGDLLHNHERIHSLILNKAYEFIEKLRMEAFTYVLVGNHDMINNQQFLTTNHWMNGLKEWDNVKIIDTVYTRNHGDHKFVFCPYVPVGRFEEALKNVSWKDASCIFAHQEFKGCKMGAIISEDGDAWNTNLPFIVSGHIHSNQLLPIGVYYPGSAMQHAFGESDHNIIPILNFKNDTHVYKEIDLGLSRKKIIYIDSNELEDFKIPTTDDEIRLTVSGTVEQFKSFKKSKKYKKMISNGIKIVYKSKKKKMITTDTQETDFFKILKKLIDNEQNLELKSDWKNISQ